MKVQTVKLCWFILLSLGALATTAWAEQGDPDLIVVSESLWGFDTTVQPKTFLPFSFQVTNVSDNPWTGTFRLERAAGSRERIGLPIETEVSLQPNETRWVQVVPFFMDDFESWRLTWGPKDNHKNEYSNFKTGPRPTVLMIDQEQVVASGGVLRRMPEELFPTSITATDALRGVVLNRVPFWQGARLRAFQEWLQQGGRVYLLHDDNGKFPTFPQNMAFLNEAASRFAVGHGVVKRIPRKVDEIDINFARREIFNDEVSDPRRSPMSTGVSDWHNRESVFAELREISKFERRWWLIYLAVIAYIGCLYPGCYRIGRDRPRVRDFYLAFTACVVVFSVLFMALGKIGGSAQNRMRSITLAQNLGQGGFDVAGWSVVANVNEGSFAFSHPGSGVTYATGQDAATFQGWIQFGRESKMSVAMPTSSTRTVMHRQRLTTEFGSPELTAFEDTELRLANLKFDIGDCFSEDILSAAAIYRNGIYELEVEGATAQLPPRATRRSLLAELQPEDQWQLGTVRWMFFPKKIEEELSRAQRYEKLLPFLIGESFGLTTGVDLRKLRALGDDVRLLVVTPTPQELLSVSEDIPDQQGVTLFVYDFETR